MTLKKDDRRETSRNPVVLRPSNLAAFDRGAASAPSIS